MTAQPASALVPILAQHIKGKTILVLGASPNSLGARFLEAIKPAEPGLVILGLRNETKAKEVASTLSPIPTRTFPVDFASFANVRTAAQQVLAMDDQIDVLVNNIGTMASPYYKTEDGFESQLQLNHLSFFLFTNLIMDKLIASKTRIVNITSEGYSLGGIRYHDWKFLGYGQGKTGQILFASALAAKLGKKGILAYSVQPGHTRGTNLHSSWGPYTIEQLG
jgi:NAD(P)-dependent dehydrogenase (short-subunit alcohol dehydrogenase family)